MTRIALTAVILAALTACSQQEAPQAPPPPEVGVVVAGAGDVPLQRELSGRLSPYRSADVRARVPGVLQQRVYTEGREVREGDVLFVIDPAQLQAALGTAQASLAQAQAGYANAKTAADRARQLAPTEFISKSDLDNALATERTTAAAVEAGRAAVDAARINLGYATVRAPIGGIAGKQQVTEGALVGQGAATLLTTVDQVDPLYVNFSIGVGELQRIRSAMAARGDSEAEVAVRLPDGREHSEKGVLDFSGDVVDPATGAVSMRARIPNPDKSLLPGTYVTLLATLGVQQGVFSIPQPAVLRDARGAYVMVVGQDGKVVRKDVRTVSASGGNWIISEGLAQGDQVVVSGVQKVKADAPAKAVPWTPAAGSGAGNGAQAAPSAASAPPAAAPTAGDGDAATPASDAQQQPAPAADSAED